MSNRFHSVLLTLLAAIAIPSLAAADKVQSPSGVLEADIYLYEGDPFYIIRRFGDEVVRPSRLGFTLANGQPLVGNFEIVGAQQTSHDETWTQPWGEKREIRSHYNEMRVELRQKDDKARRLFVVFRVFDDGVGFRYEFPEQPNLDDIVIADERTEFALAPVEKAWWIPAYKELRYEYLYEQSPLAEMPTVHTPLTCELENGLYVALHEAALVDFASMTLKPVGDGKLEADLVPWSDGVKVRGAAPMKTPWRTIQIADTPGELITSYLTLNLNQPNKLGDISWVKPGKYVGVWWDMHIGNATWGSGPTHGATTERTKKYIDFAAKHGFDGVLVEGWNIGWDGDWMANSNLFSFTQPYDDFDIEKLSEYGREKGVYLVGHHETSGGIDNYEAQLADAYDLYERLGVRAVKSGYVANGRNVQRREGDEVKREWHHGQFMVRHYLHAVKEAAKHEIMVLAHEPIKDTGLRRTYPNMIAREGARGQEYNAWDWQGGNPPDHTVILPFTRMLSGPMDFTPGVFDLLLETGDRPENRVNTTLAKQLALYVVIFSPMQMAVDAPEVYEKHSDAFEFIRDVAVDWEDTRVLHAEIGDYVTIARKARDGSSKEGQWFLGSITDEVGRTLKAPLGFLDSGTTYRAEIYRDADDADWESNPGAYTIEEKTVTAADTLELRLAPGGGQAIRFVPIEKVATTRSLETIK